MLLTLHQLVQLVNEGTRAADSASTGAAGLNTEHVLLTLHQLVQLVNEGARAADTASTGAAR